MKAPASRHLERGVWPCDQTPDGAASSFPTRCCDWGSCAAGYLRSEMSRRLSSPPRVISSRSAATKATVSPTAMSSMGQPSRIFSSRNNFRAVRRVTPVAGGGSGRGAEAERQRGSADECTRLGGHPTRPWSPRPPAAHRRTTPPRASVRWLPWGPSLRGGLALFSACSPEERPRRRRRRSIGWYT